MFVRQLRRGVARSEEIDSFEIKMLKRSEVVLFLYVVEVNEKPEIEKERLDKFSLIS